MHVLMTLWPCYVPGAWNQCCALESMPACTESPIVHIYESNCVSLYTLQNTQVFRDLVYVYPAYQQFVHRLDALAVPLWQQCPSTMHSSLVWSYSSKVTSIYDNWSSWSCLHRLDGNNLCLNHISDMSILRECSNQQKRRMPWNHGPTIGKELEGYISASFNSHTLQLLSTTILTLQSMVSTSHLFVDQELSNQVRWDKGTWTQTSYKEMVVGCMT
jgi:hypothetical protein